MDNVKDFIIEYIQREYTIPVDTDIMNLNFVEEGYIDSFGFIQFVAVIEDEFGITFTDEELMSDDIRIVGKTVELVKHKMEIEAE